MANIGAMKDRLRIERPVVTRESRGQPTTSWNPEAEIWGEVEALKGRELWQAQQVQVATTDRVRVRRESVIGLDQFGPKWRIVVLTRGNRVLNIESVRWADNEGRFLEADCSGEGLQG